MTDRRSQAGQRMRDAISRRIPGDSVATATAIQARRTIGAAISSKDKHRQK